MARLFKYCLLIVICCIWITPIKAQYLCDFEYKVTKKQRKKLAKKCAKTVKEWYAANKDSLQFPADLKFTKLKYLADEKESKQWETIDTLLCNNERESNVELAKKKMEEFELSVFDIRATFHHPMEINPLINSILYFQFDITGKLLRVVFRRKEMSPTSEIYYH